MAEENRTHGTRDGKRFHGPRRIGMAVALAASALFAGCASQPTYQANLPPPSSSASTTVYYGVVDSIQLVNQPSSGPGVGAVVGGVVGGLLGNQVGGGLGRAAVTVAGAVGGAVVGNQIEHRNDARAGTLYQITVRINDGSYQQFQTDNVGNLHNGVRVRIQNGVLYPY
ncbi:MAG: glycine zipper 2TM domain-containing protein [Burkholderiaceae bacterium]